MHPALLLLLLLISCIGFGWWQNRHARVGGMISAAKVAWLYLALACLLLLPAVLWRDSSLSAGLRRLFGIFFAGYLLRGMIEMPLLWFTRIWRCWHGIAHNFVMFAIMILLAAALPDATQRHESAARWFLPLLGAALTFESLNAWLFSKVGKPEAGVYFASNEAQFHTINKITWTEVVVLASALALWLRHYSVTDA